MERCIACNIELKDNETELCSDCLKQAYAEKSLFKYDLELNLEDVIETDKKLSKARESLNGTYYFNKKYFGTHIKSIQIKYYALSLLTEDIGELKKVKTIRTKMKIRRDDVLKRAKNINAILT